MRETRDVVAAGRRHRQKPNILRIGCHAPGQEQKHGKKEQAGRAHASIWLVILQIVKLLGCVTPAVLAGRLRCTETEAVHRAQVRQLLSDDMEGFRSLGNRKAKNPPSFEAKRATMAGVLK